MPGLFHEPIGRRRFLRTTFVGAAGMVFGSCRTFSGPGGGRREFHLALLSDTHIPADPENGYRGFSPRENLRRAVAEALAAEAEAMVVSGDAARTDGAIEDYQELRRLLEPAAARMPIAIGLGNHDHRENLLRVFPEQPGLRPPVEHRHVLVIEHGVVRVIVLDSLLYVNQVAGLLGQAQRDWLAGYLPTIADRPAVLVVHHSPGNGDWELLDADRLFQILRPHRHVKAVFHGHTHAWGLGRRHDVDLVNLPSVGFNFRDQDPVGWVEARFLDDGVHLVLHAIGGSRAEDGRGVELAWT